MLRGHRSCAPARRFSWSRGSAAPALSLPATLCGTRWISEREKNRRQNANDRRRAIDRVFEARDVHRDRVAQLELQEEDPAAALNRRTKPITFAVPPPADADEGATELATERGANASTALLEVDDPDFSVLTDDAFEYFPADAEATQRVEHIPGANVVPPGMRRYRLELQYRGDSFLGWDRAREVRRRGVADALQAGKAATEQEALQQNLTWAGHALGGLRSAKDAVDEALAVALDATAPVSVVPAVTLETGVHARRLMCHVDLPSGLEMQPRTIMLRAHVWLHQKKDPLGILSLERAPPDFHAGRAATRRVYVYRILNRIAPPLFDVGQHWHVDRHLDEERMADVASELFVGTRDFGAFADRRIARALRSAQPEGTIRTIDDVRVVRQEDEVLIWFVGSAFLRQSIRSMVSALKLVGQGLWSRDTVLELLDRGFDPANRSRSAQLPPAPAHGLTLWEMQYPAAMGSPAVRTDAGPIER